MIHLKKKGQQRLLSDKKAASNPFNIKRVSAFKSKINGVKRVSAFKSKINGGAQRKSRI